MQLGLKKVNNLLEVSRS